MSVSPAPLAVFFTGIHTHTHTHTHRCTEVRSGVFMMCDLICWLSKQVDNTRGWTLERERERERETTRGAGRERARERDTQGVWKSILSAFYHSWVAGGSKVNPILLSATVTLQYWQSYLKQHWLNQTSANTAEALKWLMEPTDRLGIQTNGFIGHWASHCQQHKLYTLFYSVVFMKCPQFLNVFT